jgi:hypothetical protein
MNRNIRDYSIATTQYPDENRHDANLARCLKENVKAMIKKGWQPYGSAIVVNGEIMQPMVKYDA